MKSTHNPPNIYNDLLNFLKNNYVIALVVRHITCQYMCMLTATPFLHVSQGCNRDEAFLWDGIWSYIINILCNIMWLQPCHCQNLMGELGGMHKHPGTN